MERSVGFIGLGRMGMNMALRLKEKGHRVVGFSRSEKTRKAAAKDGVDVVSSMEELIKSLPEPKIIWTMVPSGEATDNTLEELNQYLSENDIIIEGGNSLYKGSIKRSERFKNENIHYMDVGVSGGIWGRTEGYCIMAGGEQKIYDYLEPIFLDLCVEGGCAYVGKSGAGHFVKMIHNGIEYAIMQAYGEGFDLLHSKKEFDLDLVKISNLWNKGSVIRSWLLELCSNAFKKEKDLFSIKGYVEDSGEGRWTVIESIENSVSAPLIALSLMQRFASRQDDLFSNKVIAALRNEFGGHSVKKEKK